MTAPFTARRLAVPAEAAVNYTPILLNLAPRFTLEELCAMQTLTRAASEPWDAIIPPNTHTYVTDVIGLYISPNTHTAYVVVTMSTLPPWQLVAASWEWFLDPHHLHREYILQCYAADLLTTYLAFTSEP